MERVLGPLRLRLPQLFLPGSPLGRISMDYFQCGTLFMASKMQCIRDLLKFFRCDNLRAERADVSNRPLFSRLGQIC